MLLIGVVGLVAAIHSFQPNTVLLTARNNDKEPLTFDLKLTGFAFLCGVFILLCFSQAVLSFARARSSQNQAARAAVLAMLPDDLTPEEFLRLVEHGSREESSQKKVRQLRLAWPPSHKAKEKEDGRKEAAK